MDNKQGLINDLLNNGKGDRNWLDIAKQYEIGEGLTNEQRSKKANDIYRAYLKKENKNLEDFEKNSKVKRVSKWQNSQDKWKIG
jgi:uncharacterized FlgJ-related protein